MNYYKFIDFLANLDKNSLPGIDSQKKMVPYKINPNIREFVPQADSKESAVLIILNVHNPRLMELIFTLRSSQLRKHSGQISFPGGRKEPGETNIETALRETQEEIGILPNKLEIINEITQLYVPPSNNIIYPIIAYSKEKLEYKINPSEVDEVIKTDFSLFLDKDNLKYSSNLYLNQLIPFPYWDIKHSTPLWGATAIILQEIIDLFYIYKKSGN